MNNRINAIFGAEPPREGEYPTTYVVGTTFGWSRSIVARIERREENLGTYGILWFDIFDGDVLLASMNAMAVSEVHYAKVED